MKFSAASRRDFLGRAGMLVVGLAVSPVLAAPRDRSAYPTLVLGPIDPENLDSWIAVTRDEKIIAYSGRVDIGTGTETALGQFVADELDVSFHNIRVILGDTRVTPNQGKTTASLNMVRGSQPVRVAAAEARSALIRLASAQFGEQEGDLFTQDGKVRSKRRPSFEVSYGRLIGDGKFSVKLEAMGKGEDDIARGVMLKPRSRLKNSRDYKVVGTSVPRVELPAKVTGEFEYIHNVRVPGMLHGRVVRPPARGARLLSVSASSIDGIPGARVVRRNDFLGVVAPREEDAIEAALLLRADWTQAQSLPDMDRIYDELEKRDVIDEQVARSDGNITTGLSQGSTRHAARYDFPFQSHGMIGPSCAIADVTADRASIWSGSQWPQGDRGDIASMLGLPFEKVDLIWKAAAGSYGRLACDDAAADAAVMSQLVGRPVRVQWMREDEHGWGPVSTAMAMRIDGSCAKSGKLTAFDYVQYSPSHSTGEKGNHIAWHLIGGAPGHGRLSGGAADFWYACEHMRIKNVFVEPWLRGIYFRSPGGIQSVFAYESFVEELASLAGIDPLHFRMVNTSDQRSIDVLSAVAQLSNWQPRVRTRSAPSSNILKGRGLSVARYDSLSGLVVDIEIDRRTGVITPTHAYIAFDCGYAINPDGLLNQVEGGLIQGLSRALYEEVKFDRHTVTSLDWTSYPILRFEALPEVHTRLISDPDVPWRSAAEAGTVATAAAVANAVFDATGTHPRRLPLTAEYVSSLIH